MTDRELLELAAKAAGMQDDFALDDENNKIECVSKGFQLGYQRGWWNPLTDDGDALRLAVKLNLSMDLFDDEILVGYTPNCNTCEQVVEDASSDQFAATRRAIVRAAAEIGKAK